MIYIIIFDLPQATANMCTCIDPSASVGYVLEANIAGWFCRPNWDHERRETHIDETAKEILEVIPPIE